MFFSVGLLYSCQELINFIDNEFIKKEEDLLDNYITFHLANAVKTLENSINCKWLIKKNNKLLLSELGKKIAEENNAEKILRLQLVSMIDTYKPSWANRIKFGRKEVMNYVNEDIYQCFYEANTLESIDDDIIEFWDKCSRKALDSKMIDKKIKLFRKAEKLSINYEYERTNKKPIYQSIESNFSGYDILSVNNKDENIPLKIEVKATSKLNNIEIYVTKNEWEVAIFSKLYFFHVWIIHNKINKLAIFDKEYISRSIPIDIGKGDWEKVKILIPIEDFKKFEKTCND